MSSPLELGTDNARLDTINWACQCLSNKEQAGKRLSILDILISCIEGIGRDYDVSFVCQTLRKLLEDASENDEIYGKAQSLLLSIMNRTSNNHYISKNMERTTASILFLDVQGFSCLNESEVKCFFEEILKDLVYTIVNKYRDVIDDINTWGDGLIIITKEPYKMARLALDIRDFYRNYDWVDKRMPKLFVRIALHHGVVYTGFDHFREIKGVIGTEVTLGARLEPIVEPNQIWCTNEFKVLIKQSVDDNIHFDPLGNKDFAKDHGEYKTYRLRWGHET